MNIATASPIYLATLITRSLLHAVQCPPNTHPSVPTSEDGTPHDTWVVFASPSCSPGKVAGSGTKRLTAYELRFGPAVAVFLPVSAVAHFYLSTIGYGWYVRSLRVHTNPARFYEYALSSSLMIVLIGVLVGIWDLGSLILMFGISATMNFFGVMTELHNQSTQRTNWTAFIFGCIAGIIP